MKAMKTNEGFVYLAFNGDASKELAPKLSDLIRKAKNPQISLTYNDDNDRSLRFIYAEFDHEVSLKLESSYNMVAICYKGQHVHSEYSRELYHSLEYLLLDRHEEQVQELKRKEAEAKFKFLDEAVSAINKINNSK